MLGRIMPGPPSLNTETSAPGPPTAAVDHFECKPAECVLHVTLRLQGGAIGSVELMEQAILQLCEML